MHELEEAKNRCRSVMDRINDLPLSKITESCKQTLHKLVNAELRFLSRLPFSQEFTASISTNIGYLECIVHILQQPCITGVSRVCKPIPPCNSNSKPAHVDIVCTLGKNPVWFIVSARNPKYISWSGSHRNKGLRKRVELVMAAAHSSLTLKPTSIILFFSDGINEDASQKLSDEFGASKIKTELTLLDSDIFVELEGEWVEITARGYQGARVFELTVDNVESNTGAHMLLDHNIKHPITGTAKPDSFEFALGLFTSNMFCGLISEMQLTLVDGPATPATISGGHIINFDTTALVAIVSGISNGSAEQLVKSTKSELIKQFKSNAEFVVAQAKSELHHPILEELRDMISGKRCIICESVHLEFGELVSMCGGPKEKLRAECLLKCLLIVPDSPSTRVMGLPTTRKLALKNKIVFGTGDHWCAPTLTANIGFVRAICQTGMSLLTLEHRPRALTGD